MRDRSSTDVPSRRYAVRILLTNVGADDARTLARVAQRDRPSVAARRAGDERDAACEPSSRVERAAHVPSAPSTTRRTGDERSLSRRGRRSPRRPRPGRPTDPGGRPRPVASGGRHGSALSRVDQPGATQLRDPHAAGSLAAPRQADRPELRGAVRPRPRIPVAPRLGGDDEATPLPAPGTAGRPPQAEETPTRFTSSTARKPSRSSSRSGATRSTPALATRTSTRRAGRRRRHRARPPLRRYVEGHGDGGCPRSASSRVRRLREAVRTAEAPSPRSAAVARPIRARPGDERLPAVEQADQRRACARASRRPSRRRCASVAPVMWVDSSDASQATSAATSSPVPKRPDGGSVQPDGSSAWSACPAGSPGSRSDVARADGVRSDPERRSLGGEQLGHGDDACLRHRVRRYLVNAANPESEARWIIDRRPGRASARSTPGGARRAP